ncbi:MAG TPA: FAD-binding oxidoreductase [Chitinophagales bacterium]|nr:FAD-binding oxidoreductase [Chitinophagales bacterium]HRP39127.1 FAD-binding oxidoreductase [Chitinophagales bacterium]
MSKFNKLKVASVNRETVDSVSVSFEIPEHLKNQYQYIPGQYLTLKLFVYGEQLNRSYSFCSSPFANEMMTIAVKEVSGGKGSTYINRNIKVGDEIEVMEPMGNFHSPLSAENEKHYLLFGGGSGITPLFSILKSVLLHEPKSRVTLFYGNRDEESIIFKEQLQALQAENSDKVKLIHILNLPSAFTPYSGFLLKDVALKLLRENTDMNFAQAEFFICGPVPMMKEVESALTELSIPKAKTHIEYFTEKADADKNAASVGATNSETEPFNGKAHVKLIYDGNEVEFDMTEDQLVLHAALDAGYDPPYSCMVAACCTCRAKLLEGSVVMDDRESLTDSEIAKGYVLTCQSHPKTSNIVLNYDV